MMIDTLRLRLHRFFRRLWTRPRIDLPLAFALLVLCGVGLVTPKQRPDSRAVR